MKKLFSGIILALLLASMLTVAFGVQPVRSDYAWTETIYVRADGSIQPSTAPISSADNVTYTLTDNIAGNVTDHSSAMVIQRDNITIDGAGFTLQGPGGPEYPLGINLTGRNNTTIKNMKITAFYDGVWLASSTNDSVSGNNITANSGYGIFLDSSSNYNSISGNNITANHYAGIWLESSSKHNSISGNTFTNDGLFVWDSNQNSVEDNTVNGRPLVYLEGVSNYTVAEAGQVVLVRCENIRIEGLNLSRTITGIELWETSNSTISGNNITANNRDGIDLFSSSDYNSITRNNITANSEAGIDLDSSSGNSIFHNTFVNNNPQVYPSGQVNTWDEGYPSGGNYWSDYMARYPNASEIDGSGIWNTPYIIDANNTDHYPLMNVIPIPEFSSTIALPLFLLLLTLAITIGYKKRPRMP